MRPAVRACSSPSPFESGMSPTTFGECVGSLGLEPEGSRAAHVAGDVGGEDRGEAALHGGLLLREKGTPPFVWAADRPERKRH
jgi:hypothetical protein